MAHSFDVKALRERIGWKQGRLARYLGVDRSSVSRMENGQPVSGPALRLLEMLCDAADKGLANELCPDVFEAAE